MRVNPGSNPLPARPQAAPAAPAGVPDPNVIEADVGLRLSPESQLAGNGTVALNRQFVERLIRRVTQNRQTIKDVNFAYDAKLGAYTGTAKVKVKGLTFDVVAQAVPAVSHNEPAIQFKDFGLKLGGMTLKNPLITRLAMKQIAAEISKSRIQATAEKDTVRLEPNSVMYKINAMPDFLRIDSVATTLTSEMAANGDVRFQMKSTAPEGRSETTQSDLNLAASAEDLKGTLAPLLAGSYDLKSVTFGNGTITLDGEAEAKIVSDVANAGKLIMSLIKLAGGMAPGADDFTGGRAMIPLKLTAQIQGTQATLTPSVKQALPQIEKMLAEKGAKPERVGDSLRFDLAPLSGRLGLKDVAVTPDGLKAKARIDIPGMIKSPILRGEQV
jgi:hypothetical protein